MKNSHFSMEFRFLLTIGVRKTWLRGRKAQETDDEKKKEKEREKFLNGQMPNNRSLGIRVRMWNNKMLY